MLLTTDTELLMGEGETAVETSTRPLPSLQRWSLQSTCFTHLAVEGLELPTLKCQRSAQKQIGLDSCNCQATEQSPEGEAWPCLPSLEQPGTSLPRKH